MYIETKNIFETLHFLQKQQVTKNVPREYTRKQVYLRGTVFVNILIYMIFILYYSFMIL